MKIFFHQVHKPLYGPGNEKDLLRTRNLVILTEKGSTKYNEILLF